MSLTENPNHTDMPRPVNKRTRQLITGMTRQKSSTSFGLVDFTVNFVIYGINDLSQIPTSVYVCDFVSLLFDLVQLRFYGGTSLLNSTVKIYSDSVGCQKSLSIIA